MTANNSKLPAAFTQKIFVSRGVLVITWRIVGVNYLLDGCERGKLLVRQILRC